MQSIQPLSHHKADDNRKLKANAALKTLLGLISERSSHSDGSISRLGFERNLVSFCTGSFYTEFVKQSALAKQSAGFLQKDSARPNFAP
jgi:hypothetical protein